MSPPPEPGSPLERRDTDADTDGDAEGVAETDGVAGRGLRPGADRSVFRSHYTRVRKWVAQPAFFAASRFDFDVD